MTAHDIRHTAASLAVSAEAHVKAVQTLLGHASAAMTLDVYSGLFDDELDALADRLDEHSARTLADQSGLRPPWWIFTGAAYDADQRVSQCAARDSNPEPAD